MKTKVIKREGCKCLQNYEDNEVNIRLYVEDESERTDEAYTVEYIDLEDDFYYYYEYPQGAWGPALTKYNYLVNQHIFNKKYENFGEAESIQAPNL